LRVNLPIRPRTRAESKSTLGSSTSLSPHTVHSAAESSLSSAITDHAASLVGTGGFVGEAEKREDGFREREDGKGELVRRLKEA